MKIQMMQKAKTNMNIKKSKKANIYDNKILKELEIQNQKIIELTQELEKSEKIKEILQNKISQQEQELIKLRSELKDKDIDFISFSKNDIIFNDEDKIKINFSSLDQKINISLFCTNYEVFAEVEEKLYQKFPKYRDTNNCFFSNGQQILRFKTIEENKLENDKTVILVIPSENEKFSE